jgi:hypothetical protein
METFGQLAAGRFAETHAELYIQLRNLKQKQAVYTKRIGV